MTKSDAEKECNCQVEGIAILPVRYTVVPTYINSPKPDWANLSSVIKVPLSEGYQYHVRSLREGFLYVYLPIEKGNDKWQIYSIDTEGHLFKQYSNKTAKPIDDSAETDEYCCPNLSRDNQHNSFITIQNPTEQQKIYIAYSEFKWSERILKKYETNPSERMQEINISQWKGSGNSAIVANQTNIEQILDYDPKFDKTLLLYDDQHLVQAGLLTHSNNEKPQKFSYAETLSYNRNGLNDSKDSKGSPYGFNEIVLNKNTTCHIWTKQQNQSHRLTNSMAKYSEGYVPMLLAIDDSLGIAQELNGYYNEIFGKNEQYRQEREFEFNAIESYDYAMQILIQKEFMDDFRYVFTEHPYLKRVIKNKKIERSADLPVFSTSNQLSVLVYEELNGKPYSGLHINQIAVNNEFNITTPPVGYRKELYYLERDQFLYGNDSNKYSREGKLEESYNHNYKYLSHTEKAVKSSHTINKIEQYASDLVSNYKCNEKSYKAEKEEKVKKIKNKYACHLNSNDFDNQYKLLLTNIAKKAEIRAEQVINWIKQSCFYEHLKDLDGNEWLDIVYLNEQAKDKLDNQFEIDSALADNEITTTEAKDLQKINLYGMIYSSVIERSTAGLELTEIGKKQVELWFQRDNANQDNSDSLLWRGIADNSDDILVQIRQLLEQAKNVEPEANLDEVYSKTKIGKLAGYYKKTQGFINALNNYQNAVADAKNLGLTIPKESALFKLLTSKPALTVNNLILRLSNVVFFPLNVTLQIPNSTLAYLFHFSLCGVPKSSTLLFLQSQNAINHYILTSPLQTRINLPGGVLGQLSGSDKEQILKRNAQYLRLKETYYTQTRNILNERYRDQVTSDLKIDTKTIPQTKPTPSKGIKDARIALLIGIFDAYNWYQLKQKNAALELDEFWTLEMTKTSLALAASTAEIVAQYTKVVTGSKSVAAGRTKILSGAVGAIIGIVISIEKWNVMLTEYRNDNYGIATLNFLNAVLYFSTSLISISSSITYHIPWCEKLIARKLAKQVIGRAISDATLKRAISIGLVNLMARRAILLAAGFWLGLIALAIEGLIWWLTDDDLENFLQYSALGTENDHTDAYHDITEQKDAFKKMLESMFGINEAVLTINDKSQIEVKTDSIASKNNTLDSEFNEYDALLLIAQDLEKQKQFRTSILADIQAKKQIVEKHNQEAEHINVNGYSVPDIFSGRLN